MKERLLEQIKSLVSIYNDLPDVEEMVLITKSSIENLNLPEDTKKEIDTSNYVVCRYGNDEIGIFKKFQYTPVLEKYNHENSYEAGYFYESILTNDIAVITTHEGNCHIVRSYSVGDIFEVDNKKHLVTCKIKEELNFEDVRRKYYSDYGLNNFNYGKTTKDEIVDILYYVKRTVEEKKGNKLAKILKK